MTVNEKVWYDVFKRDNGFCKYCGFDLLSSFSAFCCATVDHIISKKLKGDDSLENLVLCCSGCNSLLSKAHDLKTFAERKKKIQTEHLKKIEWFKEFSTSVRKQN